MCDRGRYLEASKAQVILLLLFCAYALLPQASEATVLLFTLNTSPLIARSSSGPFLVEFQLNDGRGIGDRNNKVVISSFAFGGGHASGSPTVTGGASGNLSGSVSLTDSAFFNDFVQSFVPGSDLQFNVDLSTQDDLGSFPDKFSVAILDRTRTEIPTGGPMDTFLSVDISSQSLTIALSASDPSRPFPAGGSPISTGLPSLVIVPEPSPLALLVIPGMALMCRMLFRLRQRRREHAIFSPMMTGY
jgi:hypothetical protein